MRFLAGLVLSGALLGACTGGDSEGVLDCGEYHRRLGMAFDPDPFAVGHDCIIRASETGQPAVLVERWPLTGGGTSTSEFRVLPGGAVRLTGQTTGDENMSDVSITSECEGLIMNQGLLEGTRCESLDG